MVRLGGVPKAADLDDEDVDRLFGVIERLIDELGAVEGRLRVEQQARKRLDEELSDLIDTTTAALRSAHGARREVSDEIAIADQAAQEARFSDRS
jgi:hypothetical protein